MSHRGSNLAEGISLTTTSASGVKTTITFAGETVVFDREQDMEPILEHVREMRERNAGKGWGEGKEVGHIPELFRAKIMLIRDDDERRKAVRRFFIENPVFCAYAPYLRGLRA